MENEPKQITLPSFRQANSYRMKPSRKMQKISETATKYKTYWTKQEWEQKIKLAKTREQI